MKVDVQRRMAADVLNVGVDRVWFDPSHLKDIKEAITKSDIRSLIKKGWIKKKPVQIHSRGRARVTHAKKRKGLRRGHGSRKGKALARMGSKKTLWKNRIRLQRSLLRRLKIKGKLDTKTYRLLYRRAKGGFFRSKAHLKLYLSKLLGEKQ
ncbi:MAG TPA: 50S ribosomal protein L19e [Candidatus Aenigmarchaeota archaeon]|nr:50S ribosomal protein L19e [Candidatus Aenigmarchaeota archaeon]HEX32859.1 50S ribosomal protein L19e [Candidatus Aenigmarchaeota archaeon]